MNANEIAAAAKKAAVNNRRTVVAVDGSCASGKTTLADEIAHILGCDTVHADDFFLPVQLRTEQRLSQPGGNIHHERFLSEVISHISGKEGFSYRRFDCSTASFSSSVAIAPGDFAVVEGAYCLHPVFGDYFDIAVFVDIPLEERRRRILLRNGEEKLAVFDSKWISLENKYFEAFEPQKRCRFVING